MIVDVRVPARQLRRRRAAPAPAGPHAEEAVESLSSGGWTTWSPPCGPRTRSSVFDSPPALAVVDPVVLSRYADGVVFVVDSRHTRRREARRAIEALRATGAPLLGFAFNRSSTKQSCVRAPTGRTIRRGSKTRSEEARSLIRRAPCAAAGPEHRACGHRGLASSRESPSTAALPKSGSKASWRRSSCCSASSCCASPKSASALLLVGTTLAESEAVERSPPRRLLRKGRRQPHAARRPAPLRAGRGAAARRRRGAAPRPARTADRPLAPPRLRPRRRGDDRASSKAAVRKVTSSTEHAQRLHHPRAAAGGQRRARHPRAQGLRGRWPRWPPSRVSRGPTRPSPAAAERSKRRSATSTRCPTW